MAEDWTYKVVEITGTSNDGVTEAMRSAVSRAGQTLRNIEWVEVVNIRGHCNNGAIDRFQVTLKIGFKLEDESA
jgi:flavin-binding protein dodecin